jgi:hypothetical protein
MTLSVKANVKRYEKVLERDMEMFCVGCRQILKEEWKAAKERLDNSNGVDGIYCDDCVMIRRRGKNISSSS